jgi:FkbM family methyltransferase
MIEKIYYIPIYLPLFLLLLIILLFINIFFLIKEKSQTYLILLCLLIVLITIDCYYIVDSTSDQKMWALDYKQRVKSHEPETNKLLVDLALKLPPNSMVLDAGAHVGDTGIPLAEKLSKNGRSDVTVIEIDPEGSKIDFIKSKIKKKGLTNVKTINSGLWNKKTRAKIVRKQHAGAWKIKEDPKGNVSLNTLDNLVQKLDLIHLDVEDSEYQVLLGGSKVINKFKPSIIMEVSLGNSDKAIKLLESWGYSPVGDLMERDQLFVHNF